MKSDYKLKAAAIEYERTIKGKYSAEINAMPLQLAVSSLLRQLFTELFTCY